MKDKRKFKITKIFKNSIFTFVLGLFLASIIGVGAASLLYSSDVTYDNSSSGLSSTTVQDALDELYMQAKTGGANVSCDDSGNCTVTCKQGNPTITDSGYSCSTTTTVICPSDKPKYVATSTGYKCRKLTAGEQLLAKVNVVTSGDGLYVDTYATGRYVYKGASPSNYITFSGSTWRILAVESDGTLKIMKASSIGSMAYDGNYSGAWSSSTLKTYLNETYYNSLSTTAKSYIQNHSFNAGYVTSSDSLTTTINDETRTRWTGNIALVNVSDLIKSNTNTSSCSSIKNYSSSCKTTSFIGITWLLSVFGNGITKPDNAWYVNDRGLSYGDVTKKYDALGFDLGVLPVLYLKSSITLTGSGTNAVPYQIG